jgi:hypothetical protein
MAKNPENSIRRVTPPELCKIFNDEQYAGRVERGELLLIVKKSRPTRMTNIQNYIPGTESQEIHISDNDGNLLVKAHRFLRPDMKLAASGLIDPKRIFLNGEWIGLVSPEKPQDD